MAAMAAGNSDRPYIFHPGAADGGVRWFRQLDELQTNASAFRLSKDVAPQVREYAPGSPGRARPWALVLELKRSR